MSTSQFLEEISDIERSTDFIKANIGRIQELQKQILGSTSSDQESNYENERNSLMVYTKDLLFKTKDRIKRIEYENVRLPPTDPNLILRKQRHEFLREKFTNILEEYRGAEDAYMRQQKERMGRQYRV
ncbi:10348_t:CDS:1, partial [Acaulospora morrowiae]